MIVVVEVGEIGILAPKAPREEEYQHGAHREDDGQPDRGRDLLCTVDAVKARIAQADANLQPSAIEA